MESERWGVLLFERPERAIPLAGEVANCCGLTRLDVLQGLRDERNFILDFLEPDKAQDVARHLTERGVATVAQPRSNLEVAFASGRLKQAVFSAEGFVTEDTATGRKVQLPWDLLHAVLAMHRQPAPPSAFPETTPSPITEQGLFTDIPPGRLNSVVALLLSILEGAVLEGDVRRASDGTLTEGLIEAMAQQSILRGAEEDVLLLVMGAEPMVVFTLERSGFNYSYLGERLTPSSRLNFLAVAGDLAQFGRPFYANRSFIGMIKQNWRKPLENVGGKFVERWLKERLLMMELLRKGQVPAQALAVMDAAESILFYLE